MKITLWKTFACGLLASLLLTLPSAGRVSNGAAFPREAASLFHHPVTPIDRLRSQFESSSVSLRQDSFSFHGIKTAGRLFQFDFVERPDVLNYPVTFDFTYIVALDLGFLDVSFIDPVGDEEIASETVYVYPYDTGNGRRDIHFCLNDERFKASYFFAEPFLLKDEMVCEVAYLSAHSVVSQAIYSEAVSGISFSYGEGSGSAPRIDTTNTGHMDENTAGIVYPTVAIAEILTSFDNAVGFAESHFPAPDFSLNTAATYGYRIKMNMIKEDFKKNSTLSIPRKAYVPDRDHINSQKLLNMHKEDYDSSIEDPLGRAWEEWSFGFSNLADAGCPVFAVYNLLIDVGFYTVNLPVIISYFQLCNADLAWGLAGGCILRQEDIQEVKNMIMPAVVLALTIELHKLCTLENIYVGFLELAISTALVVEMVVDWFLYNQRGIGDILDYLELFHREDNSFTSSSSTLFSDFKNAIRPRGKGILCFWNDVDENLNINYLGKAHYVYVWCYESQDSEVHYVAYNVTGNSLTLNCVESNSTRMFYFEPHDDGEIYVTENQAERKMIAYYVIDE